MGQLDLPASQENLPAFQSNVPVEDRDFSRPKEVEKVNTPLVCDDNSIIDKNIPLEEIEIIDKSSVVNLIEKFALKLDIDKIKSDNPSLIKEIDELILNDPAKSTNPNIYLLWSIKQLKSGASLFDLIPSIKYFYNNKQSFKNKDINQYSLKELENEIKNINDKRLERSQITEIKLKNKELINQELLRLKEQENQILISGTEIIFQDNDFIIYYIKSKDAAKLLGKDTKWCISMSLPGSMYYEQYTGGNTVFYFVINKNLPDTDSLYKIAIAQMRDFNNNVKDTQIFDKLDSKINESNIRNDILQLTKNDAERRPKGILAKMHDGELSDQEALSVLDLYKTNTKEFYEIVKIFIKHYKHLIENNIEGFIEKYNLNSTIFVNNFKYNIKFRDELVEKANKYIKLSYSPGLSEDWIRQNQNKVDWNYISQYQKLSEDFIREFKDNVDWNYLSIDQKLSEDFIREFKDKVDWYKISEYHKLSEDFIREFKDKVDWYKISKYQELSEDFIREFKDKVNWIYISIYQKLSEDFIREFKDNVDWNYLSIDQKLSEDFIREFKDKVDWYKISEYHKLSEDFIREFKDKVDWYKISKYQELSEDFIREFKDKVNWIYISIYQKLSEDFIREFKDKVDWDYISEFQKLSEEFIREFKEKVNWDYISEFQKLSEEFIREFKDQIFSGRLRQNKNISKEIKDKFVNTYDVNDISLSEITDSVKSKITNWIKEVKETFNISPSIEQLKDKVQQEISKEKLPESKPSIPPAKIQTNIIKEYQILFSQNLPVIGKLYDGPIDGKLNDALISSAKIAESKISSAINDKRVFGLIWGQGNFNTNPSDVRSALDLLSKNNLSKASPNYLINKISKKIDDRERLLPTLWFENKDGDRYIPDLSNYAKPPKGFNFQISRFPYVLKEDALELIQQSNVDKCKHPEDSLEKDRGLIDGYDGRTCKLCGGYQKKLTNEKWPTKWNAYGSRLILTGNSSWPEDLVVAMVRPTQEEINKSKERFGNEPKLFNISDAIILAATSCEKCLNALLWRYGLNNGYMPFSKQWNESGTKCNLCGSKDFWEWMMEDSKKKDRKDFLKNMFENI